ncbi:hypothetical protein R3I93_017076 [Phoxinus phoxinus]|uniref:Uncharacterized protein n=2 Tax=Phoxinus phoxinus TaxID=58324 RepID=A0AAN9CMQ7_9TELE
MLLLDKRSDLIKTFASLGSVTLSLLLVGFLAITDNKFTCPCRNDQNAVVTVSIFIGPAVFAFVIMFHILRPLRYGWFHCPERVEDDTQKNYPKALISCLIPPVIWIFILLLDGDYVACAMTDWNGDYVGETLRWCKPTEERLNGTNPQDLTRKFIHQSQYSGYVFISIFSVLSLAVVGIHDSCISGKCDWCPSRLLLLFGRKEKQFEGNRQDDVELSPTSSITTHPLLAFSKKQ